MYQSRTGRYLEMERGLLGMSGTMMVEDGTKCGPHGACFDGKCTAKAIAIESMVNYLQNELLYL